MFITEVHHFHTAFVVGIYDRAKMKKRLEKRSYCYQVAQNSDIIDLYAVVLATGNRVTQAV